MDVLGQDWTSIWYDVSRLMLAYLLALPIGWYREVEAHSVGLRTFPLVSVASCGFILLGTGPHMTPDSQARIIQGLGAGIGFIGGGAILKGNGSVHGTAAAASIWNTGVIGAAVAQNRLMVAALLTVLNVITLWVLLPLKQKLDQSQDTPEQK
jgi:putative Mg2+ transporter-C (MgtC) family protein